MKSIESKEEDYLNFFKLQFLGIIIVAMVVLGVYGANNYDVWSVVAKIVFTGLVILSVLVLISRKPPLEQEKEPKKKLDTNLKDTDIEGKSNPDFHNEIVDSEVTLQDAAVNNDINTKDISEADLPFDKPISSTEVYVTKHSEIVGSKEPEPSSERFESHKDLFEGIKNNDNVVNITYNNEWDKK